MQIRVKLMGMLQDKTPADGSLELDNHRATIRDALIVMDIPIDSVQVFTVNGALVRDREHQLESDDELVVLPPVGGG